jgi:phosphoglycolate phosphatase/pyrophosphatase PpaX
MKLKYRCLILDHDDTVVKSTPEIHYPSFTQTLSVIRPEDKLLSLEEFIGYCFSPGFSELCNDIMKFTKEEQEYQYKVWKSYTQTRIPDFYEGLPELINEFKSLGGILTVVSHSEKEQIERHYKVKCGIVPDMIFGWDEEPQNRKPSPYPVKEILKAFNLDKSEALVVDDLKPGLVMAKSCGVDFAGAGWSHKIPDIIAYMNSNADYYFRTVEEFREVLFLD